MRTLIAPSIGRFLNYFSSFAKQNSIASRLFCWNIRSFWQVLLKLSIFEIVTLIIITLYIYLWDTIFICTYTLQNNLHIKLIILIFKLLLYYFAQINSKLLFIGRFFFFFFCSIRYNVLFNFSFNFKIL